MVPGRSIEKTIDPREPELRERIFALATLGVRHAAETMPAPVIDLAHEPATLLLPGASFVTLKRSGSLRGCIGSIEATRPLAQDVAANAFASACRDPRFPALESWELEGLEISIATLGPQEALAADRLEALLAALRPGIDGLVVRSGFHRATFLPAVWGQLPEPAAFVDALWRKAGLPAHSWPLGLEVCRYRVHTIATRL